MPYLSDKPVGEDDFSMSAIAWHLAEGKGLVHNEGNPTTGIQPLGTLVYAGLTKIVQTAGGDRWALIRCVLFVGALTLLAFAHLVGPIGPRLAAEGRPGVMTVYRLAVLASAYNFTLFRKSTIDFLIRWLAPIPQDGRLPRRPCDALDLRGRPAFLGRNLLVLLHRLRPLASGETTGVLGFSRFSCAGAASLLFFG